MAEHEEQQELEKVGTASTANDELDYSHDVEELKGYWGSWRLIGAFAAIVLMANSLFIGYAMPV